MKPFSVVMICSALAALPVGCLGGQTGQPSSAECEDQGPLPATEKWGELSVAGWAHAFEGHYSAELQWIEETRFSSQQTPVALDDTLVIDVSYDGADARVACGQLFIPMHADASTTASGIHESGMATLVIASPAASGGLLELPGARAIIDAPLELEPEGVGGRIGASPSGTVVPTEGGAPGKWARFVDTGIGGAGP